MNSRGVLREKVEARTSEAMAKELGLWNSKLTFSQANHQAMSMAQLQNVLEMLNMRG